jgi:hypothetical protein
MLYISSDKITANAKRKDVMTLTAAVLLHNYLVEVRCGKFSSVLLLMLYHNKACDCDDPPIKL